MFIFVPKVANKTGTQSNNISDGYLIPLIANNKTSMCLSRKHSISSSLCWSIEQIQNACNFSSFRFAFLSYLLVMVHTICHFDNILYQMQIRIKVEVVWNTPETTKPNFNFKHSILADHAIRWY